MTAVAELLKEIRACRLCAHELPHEPRPVLRASPTARLLIIGQAPGTKVHASGVPWDDRSGDRLRSWLQLEREDFYDEGRVALMPMGFCFPGQDARGADLPPLPRCAPTWHPKLQAVMPGIRLTLLIGQYAQHRYMPETRGLSLTERVRTADPEGPCLPLPHPSWRNTGWLKKNLWFEATIVPRLRARVAEALYSCA